MKRLFTLLFVLSLAAAACARQTPTGAGTSPAGEDFPVTIGSVEIKERPTKIVSLSPTTTEMLFAIGADKQVVAVDDQSNYPADAPKTDLSGLTPNVEAIAKYDPDLVIHSNEGGELGSSLEAVKIPAIQQSAAKTIDDTYAQIEQLGKATGHRKDADKLVAEMKSEIRKIVASAAKFEEAPTYYHELDNTFFTVTSKTFIGQVYDLLGLRNIADEADKSGTGYPQLSAEFIIQANPDFIFLADTKCCKESAETVAKRPGWDKIAAVSQGGVVELDDDIASRWGPRVVDFLRTVSDALKAAKEKAA